MLWPTGGVHERRRCWKCGKEISKANIAKHVRAWTANEEELGVIGNVRPEEGPSKVYKPKEKACPSCGNMARHQRRCRML